MWKHKLDIDDCYISILRGVDKKTGTNYKELIIGYKTANINIYTVVVQDMTGDEGVSSTLFKHESFQLWESTSRGLLLLKNKDFIKLSKSGMDVLSIGSTSKR